jgi:hypothetical protein
MKCKHNFWLFAHKQKCTFVLYFHEFFLCVVSHNISCNAMWVFWSDNDARDLRLKNLEESTGNDGNDQFCENIQKSFFFFLIPLLFAEISSIFVCNQNQQNLIYISLVRWEIVGEGSYFRHFKK